ncbi:MAG: hypothetical protein ACPLXC_03555 [Candidatus Pacearchaeota archaeon]
MIVQRKISFILQLVNSTQEVLSALDKAIKQGDETKFDSVKQELLNLLNEVRGEIRNLK